jgi:DNA-binding CsgD family transcriptional regulator
VVLRGGSKDDLDLDRARSWVRVVARNLAVDAYRARLPSDVASRLARFEAPEVHPQTSVDDQLEASWVADLLRTLPERQQRVIRMRADDHSLDEIAVYLGCSYKTVESLLSRARASLRGAIATGAAVLAWILCQLRRACAPVGVAAVAAALAVGVSTEPTQPMPLAPAIAERTVSIPQTDAYLRADDARTHAGDTRRRSHRIEAFTSSPSAGPRGTAVVTVQRGHAGPITHGGADVERSHGDETVLETAERCLRAGPEVSFEHIGCGRFD